MSRLWCGGNTSEVRGRFSSAYRNRWVAIAVLSTSTGCRPTPAESAKVPREEPPPSSSLAEAFGGAVDFQDTPLPDAAWTHLASANRDLPVVARLDVFPSATPYLREPRLAIARFIGPALADTVDLGRPIDVLQSIDRKDFWLSASFAVRGDVTASVFQDGFAPRKVAAGRFRLSAGPRTAVTCDLAIGPPTVGPRVVCSTAMYRLEEDTAFFMTTAARYVAAKQLHVELPQELFRSAMARLGLPSGDGHPGTIEGARLARDWWFRLFSDAGHVALTANVAGTGVDLGLAFEFTSLGSPIARWLVGRPRTGHRLPAAFARLPRDADVTFYKSAPSRYRQTDTMIDDVMEKVAGVFAAIHVPEAERRIVIDAIRDLWPFESDVAVAFGQDRAKVAGALHALEGDHSDGSAGGDVASRFAELDRALTGWLLLGIERDPKPYLASAGRLLQVVKEDNARMANSLTHARKPLYGLEAEVSQSLPGGSLHLVLPGFDHDVRRAPPPAHVFVVPDGPRVWVAVSRDPAVAEARVVSVLEGGAKGGPLPMSPDLNAIAGSDSNSFGQMSVAGFVSLGLHGQTEEERRVARRRLSAIAELEGGGKQPNPIWIEVHPSGNGARVNVGVRLSKEALSDIVRVAGAWTPKDAMSDAEGNW